MYIILLIVYLLVAVSLVLLIMLQHVGGVDIGGNSCNMSNLLGGVGIHSGSNFVTRLTAVLGVLFFLLSLLLGNVNKQYSRKVYINSNARLEGQASNILPLTDDVKTVDIEGGVLKS